MVESPFSALKGVRELQYAMSEYASWLQYVCINGQDDSFISPTDVVSNNSLFFTWSLSTPSYFRAIFETVNR